MAIIRGTQVEKIKKGSLEEKKSLIENAISEKYKYEEFEILSTFDNKVVIILPDGKVRNVYYVMEDDRVKITKDAENKDNIVIENEDIPVNVYNTIKDISKAMLRGENVECTRVHEIAQLISKDEPYWMSDIAKLSEEACDNSDWYKTYDTNSEKIRTSLYGKIRDMESQIPKTRYSKIRLDKIAEFESELKESSGIIKNLFCKITDECDCLSFREKDLFLTDVCKSLTTESRGLSALLGKAERLISPSNIGQFANVHDKLADRAKSLVVMSEYLKQRTAPEREQSNV